MSSSTSTRVREATGRPSSGKAAWRGMRSCAGTAGAKGDPDRAAGPEKKAALSGPARHQRYVEAHAAPGQTLRHGDAATHARDRLLDDRQPEPRAGRAVAHAAV